MRPSKARDGLALCLGVVLLCSLVQAVGAAKGDVLIFPGLGEILRALWDMLGDAKTWKMIGVTMRHVVTAMLISAAGGVMLGLAMGLSRFVRQMMKPVMALLRTIPMIVLIVVVMVLTSYDRVPVVASVLVLIPMIAEATSEGCQRIPPHPLNGATVEYFSAVTRDRWLDMNEKPPATMDMTLREAPFRAIQAGRKRVEMRLCDEKRRMLRIGGAGRFKA